MLSGILHAPLRLFWFLTGGTALALGAAGVVLPVLPTTPFVILAAFAFGKSLPSLQARLEQSALFGPMIRDWRETGAIAPRVKVLSVSMMAAALAVGLSSDLSTLAKAAQVIALAAGAAFVLTRPHPARAP